MRAALVAISLGAAGAAAVVAISGGVRRGKLPVPRLIVQPGRIVANGYDTATLVMESAASSAPVVSVVANTHAATVDDVTGAAGKWQARIRGGVLPGRIRLRVAFRDAPAAEAELESIPFVRDTAQDGTPDFLRLDDERDRQSFRRWFTWLAEAQYFQPPAARPAEIEDCAALIRYAYREALHAHDTAWAAMAQTPPAPPFDSVAKFQYPACLICDLHAGSAAIQSPVAQRNCGQIERLRNRSRMRKVRGGMQRTLALYPCCTLRRAVECRRCLRLRLPSAHRQLATALHLSFWTGASRDAPAAPLRLPSGMSVHLRRNPGSQN
jgi:uncharacterized protein DUF1175